MVLGMTARLTISALQVAGSVIAQQLGLGFVTAVDPTQGQQGLILGNFLTLLGVTLIFATDLHHLVIAGLHDSYRLFRPGEVPVVSDVASLVTNTIAGAFRVGIQLSGAVPGVRPRVQRRARRAVAADAADAGLFRRGAALDHDRLPDPADRRRRDDGELPRLRRGRAARTRSLFVRATPMADEHDDTERSEDPTQKRLDEALERGDVVKSQEVNTWFVLAGGDADPAVVLRRDEQRVLTACCADCSRMRTKFRSTDAASCSTMQTLGIGTIAAVALPFGAADARGDRRQHGAASAGLVGREPQAEALEDLARRGLQAAVLRKSRWRTSSRA